MKQLLQSPRSGRTSVADVPVPAVPDGFVLVRTLASLVSAGTERMMVQFAEKSLVQKARARPDLVRLVLEKIQRDGVLTTLDTVRARLDSPMALGYSAAGVVLQSGSGAPEFSAGDRVACAGAGFANHAEVICVPRNLCVRIPDGVEFDDAVFATLGAIAMHGVRLAELQLASRVVVIGLGLLGQLTVQLVRASGCRVAGVDLVPDRVTLAKELGAGIAMSPADAPDAVRAWSDGTGADAVLIAADTPGNDPIELAGVLCRDRGTVVAIGSVGMTIPRRTYYAKELRFLISRSYGPGRYDESYEIEGRDYPIGYVRWTERRNLGSFLELVAAGSVRVAPLVTHRFPIADAPAAYDLITGKTGGPFLGVVLRYPDEPSLERVVPTAPGGAAARGAGTIGVLGAGGFATAILLPAFKAAGAGLRGVASRQGLSARSAADRFGFAYCTTDEDRIVGDPAVDTVVVATRHDLHARQVLAARAAGKHVFVEKPLCITGDELAAIKEVYADRASPLLMVGFNRRFAPLAAAMARFFQGAGEPLAVHYRVNAGFIPPDHWVHDPAVGGGRVIGEGCHFIDFIGWLVGSAPARVSAASLPDSGRYRGDNIMITLSYANGAAGTITYVASGDRALGKERVEVHGGGRSAVLEDFRVLETYRSGKKSTEKLRLRQDKGHNAECQAFVEAVRAGRPSPIPLADIFATTRASFLAVESARTGATLEVTP